MANELSYLQAVLSAENDAITIVNEKRKSFIGMMPPSGPTIFQKK